MMNHEWQRAGGGLVTMWFVGTLGADSRGGGGRAYPPLFIHKKGERRARSYAEGTVCECTTLRPPLAKF